MSLTPDEAGFTAFVAARGTSLQRAAFLLTGDHHLAQDLVQTALMQAAKHWSKIHTSPEAYVRRSIFRAGVSRDNRSHAVLVLRHWCGLTDSETAETLRLSVATVKTLHRQALSDLTERSPERPALLVEPIGGHR